MKDVLITGAYGGMGKQVVIALKNAGYRIFALDKAIDEPTDNVISVQVDLTQTESVQKAFEKVSSITNELYAVLHFAGIYALDSLVEMDESKLKNLFEVNFFGEYRINKTF